MGKPRNKRKLDKEFKEGAVKLVLEGDRLVREVARDLGIHENCKSQGLLQRLSLFHIQYLCYVFAIWFKIVS